MHVAHGGGFGVGSVLLNLFGGEFRPRIQVAGIDGIDPSGENWREKSGMVETYSVSEVR